MAKVEDGHNLVFIVGCSRSGTTWLQRLLACHPKIKTGQESFLFNSYIGPQVRAWRTEIEREADPKTKSGRGGLGLTCYLKEDEFFYDLKQYLLNLMGKIVKNLEEDEIFLEKTPQHALWIPEIKKLLPDSRIIHLIRDPRDVVASLLDVSKGWGVSWAPKRAVGAALFWINHVKAVKLASRFLTKHEFIELKYEDLWNDTEKNLLKLIRFLDLEWDDEGITAAIQLCSIDSVKKGTAPTFEINGEISKLNGPLTIEPKDFVKRGYPGGWRKELNLFEKIQIYLVIKRYFDNNNEYSFNLRNFLLPLK